MKYKILFSIILVFIGTAMMANPIKITPVKKISTTTKKFNVGNIYEFKDTTNGKKYTGEIIYYRPNGMNGQEAQIEIGNFKDEENNLIPGQITIIPSNHKTFQEYSNSFVAECDFLIRGSEVILIPEKHTFLINSNKQSNKTYFIKLTPVEEISTTHDKLEYGDIITFKTTNNVYKNKKLFIKENSLVYGIIDYLDENSWCGDNATIYIKKFQTRDVNNELVTINSELKINGFELLKYKSKRLAQFFNYLSAPIRGKEIDIKNYDKNINFVIMVNE